MYPSDEYLVYANEVDAFCYANPILCYFDIYSGGDGMPTTGWVYNSNNLEGSNEIYWNLFVSPYSSDSSYAFYDNSGGNLFGLGYGAGDAGGARPVVYLKSDIKITDGTGESTNPYKLGL